ncbi:MAG: hypothetical protein J6X00_00360 [Clostridia bacterium]|nr:hypothetical protein [Clostridia bacterium]
MKHFGTGGIRGDAKIFTKNFCRQLSVAISRLNYKKVMVGIDTRGSGVKISKWLIKGLIKHGMDALLVGVISTPALVYLTQKHKCLGVMITASHNVHSDNGVKVVCRGHKISERQQNIIEKALNDVVTTNTSKGKLIVAKHLLNEYYCYASKQVIKTKYKVAIDLSNGATCATAPALFRGTTDNLVIVANKPNGENINDNCGSTHIENLCNVVTTNACDVGFAFDGDGDRCIAVSGSGKVVDGDMLAYIIANYLYNKGALTDKKVAFSIMSNLGVVKALSKRGIEVIQVPVGDIYIYEAIKKHKLKVGGEESGHIIIPPITYTGDGVITALYVLKIMYETNCKLDELIQDILVYPQKLTNIKVADKEKVLADAELQRIVYEIKQKLSDEGKIIIRKSGTEDVVRVFVQAKSQALVDKYSKLLVEKVKQIQI